MTQKSNNKSYSIGIYGATGSYDFGDYCMLVDNIIKLDRALAGSRFFVFTPDASITNDNIQENILDNELLSRISSVDDGVYTSRETMSDKFSRRIRYAGSQEGYDAAVMCIDSICKNGTDMLPDDLKKVFNNLDLMIFNGGGYFQNSWKSLNIDFSLYILISKMYGIPVFIMGNSFGPLEDTLSSFVFPTLSLVDGIIVRDGQNRSYKSLLLNNLKADRICINTDDLFFHEPVKNTNNFDAPSPTLKNYVVIEVMVWIIKCINGKQSVLDILAAFMEHLVNNGYGIVLICFDKKDTVAQECISKLSEGFSSDQLWIVDQITSINQVYNIYRFCDFSVSMKYHPIVLALSYNHPCIGIICDYDGYYESKMHGAYESLGIMNSGDYVKHINELNEKWLIERFESRATFEIDKEKIEELKQGRESYMKRIVDSITTKEEGALTTEPVYMIN